MLRRWFQRRAVVVPEAREGSARELRDRIEALEAELKSIRSEPDAVRALSDELAQMRADRERAEEVIRTLREQMLALQNELKRLGAERDALRAELARQGSTAPERRAAFQRALREGAERFREAPVARASVDRHRFDEEERDDRRLTPVAAVSRIAPIRR